MNGYGNSSDRSLKHIRSGEYLENSSIPSYHVGNKSNDRFKGSQMAIFPYIGQVPPEKSFITQNSIDHQGVQHSPLGHDELTDWKLNNHRAMEHNKYLDEY